MSCVVNWLQYYQGDKRPLWFVFSGMGSQWAGMGLTLMKIPVFAQAVQKCHQLLEPKGVDLIRIITDTEPTTFDNILNSFVGIAAIQVTLRDVTSPAVLTRRWPDTSKPLFLSLTFLVNLVLMSIFFHSVRSFFSYYGINIRRQQASTNKQLFRILKPLRVSFTDTT